jgi:two-component system response regulator (stage 0 sporulation protein F)
MISAPSVTHSFLVVDDDDRVLRMICDYAQTNGYTTWEARNGLEALWIVKHHRPELVLLDLRMPRLDGFETLRHIRKFDPSIRIVVVTGDVSDETRSRIESLGLELLLKPFTLDALGAMLVARPN